MAKETVALRLERSVIERLDAIAEALGDTRSAVVERMVVNGLEPAEKFLRQVENPVLREGWGLITNPKFMAALAKLAGGTYTAGDREAAERVQKVIQKRRSRSGGTSGEVKS